MTGPLLHLALLAAVVAVFGLLGLEAWHAIADALAAVQ